ncbi:hypothetical protein LIER_01607 [Lithospermum erythrorhizon]|uniref:Uncharacterized protein n=1 Tax=Lithospermum erythrorhizon TaxID=34254 RepID=A0AAV3NLH3_LITER
MPEKSLEEPLDSSPIQCIWYPGKPNQGKPSYPHHLPDHFVGFMPIGSKEGYKNDHSYFVDTSYALPSGVEVLIILFLLSRNRSNLRDVHSWAESARVTEEFEQEKSSMGESMRKIREERDSAFAKKEKVILRCNDLLHRQEKLISDHPASERRLTSEMEILKSNS